MNDILSLNNVHIGDFLDLIYPYELEEHVI